MDSSKAEVYREICLIGQQIAMALDLDELLRVIGDSIKKLTGSEAGSILLLDESTDELYFKVAVGEKGQAIKKVRLSMGTGVAGWVAQKGEPLIVNDVSADARFYRKADDSSGFSTRSLLTVPIVIEGKTMGVAQAVNKIQGSYDEFDQEVLSLIASQAGVALRNSYLLQNLQNFKINVFEMLVVGVDRFCKEGAGHSMRVARLATTIARNLGMADEHFEHIYYGSLLHDIGKLVTDSEDQTKHAGLGADFASEVNLLSASADIIRYHHEYMDGSGLYGLKGKDIPLEARIVSFAEAFEEIEANSAQTKIDSILVNKEKFDYAVLQAALRLYGVPLNGSENQETAGLTY